MFARSCVAIRASRVAYMLRRSDESPCRPSIYSRADLRQREQMRQKVLVVTWIAYQMTSSDRTAPPPRGLPV
jgi:hypothetical protein